MKKTLLTGLIALFTLSACVAQSKFKRGVETELRLGLLGLMRGL